MDFLLVHHRNYELFVVSYFVIIIKKILSKMSNGWEMFTYGVFVGNVLVMVSFVKVISCNE